MLNEEQVWVYGGHCLQKRFLPFREVRHQVWP